MQGAIITQRANHHTLGMYQLYQVNVNFPYNCTLLCQVFSTIWPHSIALTFVGNYYKLKFGFGTEDGRGTVKMGFTK